MRNEVVVYYLTQKVKLRHTRNSRHARMEEELGEGPFIVNFVESVVDNPLRGKKVMIRALDGRLHEYDSRCFVLVRKK